MESAVFKALMLPIALLALGGVNHASASPCAAGYTMAAVTATGFSCTIGDVTFSNFNALFTPSGGAGIPDGTTDTISISEVFSGDDPNGTTATGGSPIYTVIVDYTAGNSVVENQTETSVVQYLVTDTSLSAGTAIRSTPPSPVRPSTLAPAT
jgi:hypothetical protein